MKHAFNTAVITTMQFPSGAASVNRIISYSKGLVELGTNVTVFSTSIGDIDYSFIDGIRYKSFHKKSNNVIFNLFAPIISLIKLLHQIYNEKPRFNAVILVSNSLLLIYPIFILSKLLGIKLLQEKSEYPFVLKNKSYLGRIYAKFYMATTYRLFDGLIIMTNPLRQFFKNKTKRNCKFITLPMTVDTTRFSSVNENTELGNYIAYCGDVGGNKDGVSNLIQAFGMIEKKYPSIKLLLIGGTKNQYELIELEHLSQRLKLRNVCFYGIVERDKIPSLLSNSLMLVLARPSSLQSTGGFPTKLGEYLSTGKPVLVTKVGDIPLYLEDNKNAFLAEPDDNEEFATKMSYIIDNYNMALKVAQEGKKLTQTTFNYKVQAKRLNDFLTRL